MGPNARHAWLIAYLQQRRAAVYAGGELLTAYREATGLCVRRLGDDLRAMHSAGKLERKTQDRRAMFRLPVPGSRADGWFSWHG